MPFPADIVCLATKGAGSNEEERIRLLLSPVGASVWPFDRAAKGRSALRLLRFLARRRPDLAVLEGTGVAGGVPLMLARLALGTRYVVSSGDAVAPFLAMRNPVLWPLALAYETLLYRLSAGFIGWTPYLAGRALSLGAPRAVTAEHWSIHGAAAEARDGMRARLGLADATVVFGLVGALVWSERRGYCYGLELVRALRRCPREDVAVVIAGDGDGRARLEREAGDELGRRFQLLGAIPHAEVPAHLAAFDVASLPQSLDGVGAFRYTTKLSEYVAARLPVVTGRLPFAYDLDDGWLWRLPGVAPWDDAYVDALARLMTEITPDDVHRRRERVPAGSATFDGERQSERVSAFARELLEG
jgi:hypothetical protein